jgi:hypothetical protein
MVSEKQRVLPKSPGVPRSFPSLWGRHPVGEDPAEKDLRNAVLLRETGLPLTRLCFFSYLRPFCGHGTLTFGFTPYGRNQLMKPAFADASVLSFSHSSATSFGVFPLDALMI